MLWILLELEDNENAEKIYRTITTMVIVRYSQIKLYEESVQLIDYILDSKSFI